MLFKQGYVVMVFPEERGKQLTNPFPFVSIVTLILALWSPQIHLCCGGFHFAIYILNYATNSALLKWQISIRAHCVVVCSIKRQIFLGFGSREAWIEVLCSEGIQSFSLGHLVYDSRKAGCPLFEWFLGLFPKFLILISLCTQSTETNAGMLCCGQSFSFHMNCVVQLVRQLKNCSV